MSALLLSLAMSGLVGWWPLIFVALVPLLRFTLVLSPARCSAYGLVAGFIYHLILLYWIVIVLGRYGGLPLYLSFTALVLLALYMSLYTALFCGLLSFLVAEYWHREGPGIYIFIWSAPIVWVGLDWLRGHLFTGLPWMDIGYALYSQPRLIQAADLGGHYLISFCIVLINALFVVMITQPMAGESRTRFCAGGRKVVLLAVCFLVFMGGYSISRYQQIVLVMKRSLQAGVTVVQGNIAQDAKWTTAWQRKTVDTYVGLTKKSLVQGVSELVVWPETALPFYPRNNPLMRRVVQLAKEENIYLLTGSPWVELSDREKKIHAPEIVEKSYFNSALLVNPAGRLASRYDKQHLVPFGEYVPLRQFLPFLEPLVEGVGDFTGGKPGPPVSAGQLRLGVLICFESIFPEIAREWVAGGANLLVGMTNDAWYGRSSAPYQSLAMSVFRSVETKRSLVRAANTGISGFIDPLGEIRLKSHLFQPAFLSTVIPLLTEKTLFVRFGRHFGAICLALIVPLILYRRASS